MAQNKVFLYIPNIIDYMRLMLICWSMLYLDNPSVFLPLYTASFILDYADGYAARKLDQTSAFGAWLDVTVDVISRGLVWTYLYKHWGYCVICVEWLAFISTHSRGPDWKSSFNTAPWIVSQVFKNGFRSPMGMLAMAGLDLLPPYLYIYHSGLLGTMFGVSPTIASLVLCGLICCRLLCMIVEVYVITEYIVHLARKE